jgi:hypothetical protein
MAGLGHGGSSAYCHACRFARRHFGDCIFSTAALLQSDRRRRRSLGITAYKHSAKGKTMVTKPTINLNGTSAKQLLEEHLLAIDAMRTAISTHAMTAPYGRDYQPTGAFAQAQLEHTSRRERLESVISELEQIAKYISVLRHSRHWRTSCSGE